MSRPVRSSRSAWTSSLRETSPLWFSSTSAKTSIIFASKSACCRRDAFRRGDSATGRARRGVSSDSVSVPRILAPMPCSVRSKAAQKASKARCFRSGVPAIWLIRSIARRACSSLRRTLRRAMAIASSCGWMWPLRFSSSPWNDLRAPRCCTDFCRIASILPSSRCITGSAARMSSDFHCCRCSAPGTARRAFQKKSSSSLLSRWRGKTAASSSRSSITPEWS